MIPEDPEDLDALAGEYVLGVLDARETREVETALAVNDALRRAVQFWEERLHPLSAMAPDAEPPADGWDRISARIAATPVRHGWNPVVLWRRTALAAIALAACLAVYIAVTPIAPSPQLVALLHAPTGAAPVWMASAGRNGLVLRAIADRTVPSDRDLELWAIAPGAKPQPLGIIPADGQLSLGTPSAALGDGVTLAISVEPKGGSPTGQPTGAVVFVGTLVKAS